MIMLQRMLSVFCFLVSVSLAKTPLPRDSGNVALNPQQSARFDAFLAQRKNDSIQNKLSTLWTVVSLNMIGADVLASYIPGTQEDIESFAGGKKNVKYFMLSGAIIYEIPISMIFLSHYMPYKVNRWVNVGAAAFTELTILGGGSLKPHYLFMASAETLALSYITWTSFNWPNPASGQNGVGYKESKNDLGLNLNAQEGLYGLKYSYKF